MIGYSYGGLIKYDATSSAVYLTIYKARRYIYTYLLLFYWHHGGNTTSVRQRHLSDSDICPTHVTKKTTSVRNCDLISIRHISNSRHDLNCYLLIFVHNIFIHNISNLRYDLSWTLLCVVNGELVLHKDELWLVAHHIVCVLRSPTKEKSTIPF